MTRMDEIEHTNPHTGEAFGANGGVFARGPAAADGGTDDDEMKNVDHEAPDGDGANEVWERGQRRPDADDDEDATDGDATDEVKAAETVSEGEINE